MAVTKVRSEVAGTAWKILASVGQQVAEDDDLMIAESMKMEIPVTAPCSGTVSEVCVDEGAQIAEDELLFVIEA